MPAIEILAILDRLNHAYPDRRLTKPTLKLYVEQLSDIPTQLLDRAVSQHIQNSPWFPHISDLRQAAQQLAGSANFASLPPPGEDFLALEMLQLENDYFQRGMYNPHAWDALADQLERVGRPYRAEELRRRSQHIQELEAASQRGDEYPPCPERPHYADRDTQV